MIAATLQYAFAHTTPALAQLGLKGEAIGLWGRATRHRAAWQHHEAECHRLITAAVERLKQHHCVMVLGSGLCRDVPVADLAQRFARVVLVDAVHLPLTRLGLRHFNTIRFETLDLTGAADWVTGRANQRVNALPALFADHRPDLIISANCLSQLPIAIEKWLEHHPNRAAQLPTNLPDQAIGWHVSDLREAPCPVCLITDVEMLIRDRQGAILDRLDLIAPFRLPEPDQTWPWPVAPMGEESVGKERIHRVHGYVDLAVARNHG